MTAKILQFTGISRLDIPVEKVIAGAEEVGLTDIVVIGFDGDGDFYFAGSKADGAEVLWLLERARHKLMKITDEMEDGDVEF